MVSAKWKVVALFGVLPVCSSCEKFEEMSSSKLSDRFGVSYDDCILKNLTAGLSTESVNLVRQACVHAWERESNTFASVETSMEGGGDTPRLEFQVENTGSDVATRVQIGVEFKMPSKSEKLYWTYPVNLEPGQSINLTGSFSGGKAPSQKFSTIASDTQFTRILSVKKAAAAATKDPLTDD